VLGIVASAADYGLVDTATNTFIGPHAVDIYGAPVPLDGGAWAPEVTSFGEPTMMAHAPYNPAGARYSSLDWAAMTDQGWQIHSPYVTASPTTAVTVGSVISVHVAVIDPNGIEDMAYHGPVTISLGNHPAGATLKGTLTVIVDHGFARFDGLT